MAIFIPTSPSNPFIKLAVPVVAILFVYVVARARKMTASDLMLQKPPAQAALIWVAVYAIFVLGTDPLFNWRGKFDFTVWRAQPFCHRLQGAGCRYFRTSRRGTDLSRDII
jgi:hypothetical protein